MATPQMPTNYDNKNQQSLDSLVDLLAGIYESLYIIATVAKQWGISQKVVTESDFEVPENE